jgi:hypothetical protein
MNRWALGALGLLALALVSCVAYYPPPPPPPPPPYDQGPPPGGPGAPPPDQGYAPGGEPAPAPGDAGSDAGDAAEAPSDQQPADVSQFYDALSPYGEWEQTPAWGWVWIPRGVAPGWRPYTEGHWINSDAGWAWESDEPFGWAAYHYGRWYDDPGFGWAWVPGPVWGPAWVAWRSGGGYIGWAPLPPSVGWRAGFGLELGGVDLSVAIGPSHFCFVGEHDFLAVRLHEALVPFARSVTFVRRTTNVTSYAVVNHRVVDRGVAVVDVERAVGHSVPAVHVATVSAVGRAGVHGDTVGFYRPPALARAAVAGRAAAVGRPAEPPARAVPNVTAEELDRRHADERQNLASYQEAQRQRLADVHQRELDAEKSAAGRAQLQHQHEEERNMQQQLHQRQTQVMQSRQQHERERVSNHGHPH